MRRDVLYGREPIAVGLGTEFSSVSELSKTLSGDVPENGGKDISVRNLLPCVREVGNSDFGLTSERVSDDPLDAGDQVGGSNNFSIHTDIIPYGEV